MKPNSGEGPRSENQQQIEEVLRLKAEYERKIRLSDDPKERLRSETELNRLDQELEHLAPPSKNAGQIKRVSAIPPDPDFVHPHILQEYFTGRRKEREVLSDWLRRGEKAVCVVRAIGGMGKSSLAWVWVVRDVMGRTEPGVPRTEEPLQNCCGIDGILWWSFYDNANCGQFVEEALTYINPEEIAVSEIASAFEKNHILIQCLDRRRYLMVLDGFEHELCGLSPDSQYEVVGPDYGTCADPYCSDFVRRLSALSPGKSAVLFTSRVTPRELAHAESALDLELLPIDPQDAVAFFRQYQIAGSVLEIEEVCRQYGYHGLALRLLAGLIVTDPINPRDVRAAADYDVSNQLIPREHHVVELAYRALRPELKELVDRVSVFRSQFPLEGARIASPSNDDEALRQSLMELKDRGLLQFDPDHARFGFHPVVRSFAYNYLKDREEIHARLALYYSARFAEHTRPVSKIEDLEAGMECYYHMIQAGKRQSAMAFFQDRLSPYLDQFGAHFMRVRLLEMLFGNNRYPHFAGPRSQAWVLNTMANSFSFIGQPERSTRLFEHVIAISTALGDPAYKSTALLNLADDQIKLGRLRAAKASIDSSIQIWDAHRRHAERLRALAELSRLLILEGQFEPAAQYLDSIYPLFHELQDHYGLCLVWCYRTLAALMSGLLSKVTDTAANAFATANETGRADLICQSLWLKGAADLVSSLDVQEATATLTEALTRTRRAGLVAMEPDVLCDLSKALLRRGELDESMGLAEEALHVSTHCRFVLKASMAHLTLARIGRAKGDRHGAAEHASSAMTMAYCDGPPDSYWAVAEKAERLLREVSAAS